MIFPTKEIAVAALADEMVSGLAVHGVDFPNVDAVALGNAVMAYKGAKDTQSTKKSQSIQATTSKYSALDDLKAEMRTAIAQATIDVVANPEKITEIGCSPKSPPTPLEKPGQAESFNASFQGQGSVIFVWSRPLTGGKATNYIIQRRIQVPDGEPGQFESWLQVYTSFQTDAEVASQPRGLQLEYRVIATNPAGQAIPSNTVSLVL